MSRVAPIVVAAVVILAAGASATSGVPQATTTFVSGHGFDTNPCTLTAPCRSFAAAVAVTNPGGQVTMLDPAGYGTVTISKAISIVNDGGGEAGINDPGAGINAITINAGASDVVNLRGLTLNGVGTGSAGIRFNSGGALNIQNCQIRGFVAGVFAQPTSSVAFTTSDTILSNNAAGIAITQVAGSATAHLERVAAISNSGDGIFLAASGTSGMLATVVDSVAAGNKFASRGHGFELANSGTGATSLTLINSKAIGNDIGLESNRPNTGSAIMSISHVAVAENSQAGFQISGTAVIQSFGDNYIIDTNNSGSLTPIGAQ